MPVENAVTGALQVAAALEPIIAPEVYFIMGLINAHRAANAGKFPTPEQVDAGYTAIKETLQGVWAGWVPHGS